MVACSSSIPAEDGEGSQKNGTEGTFGSSGSSSSGTSAAPCVPNPASAEIPDNSCDDDGDGKVDNVEACDASLPVTGDAEAFAKALGLCTKVGAGRDYGLVSATFTRGYNSAAAANASQHGILPKFGSVITPREGASLGVLSTGYAREFDDANGTSTSFKEGILRGGGTAGAVPPGYPKPAEGCKQATGTNDVIDVKLTIKAPPNATGFTFDFDFYSSEWPEFVCSEFNDGFVAYLSAKGFNGGKPENISFDSKKNPVSVNNGFFDRCTPNAITGCMGDKRATSVCPGGAGELAGTGFGIEGRFCGGGVTGAKTASGGATGWLTSTAPVEPGETFTLEFIIWDTGDAQRDSSVLLDKFRWVGGAPVAVGTSRSPR